MSILTPVEEIMKSEAEFGLFFCRYKMGKVKAQSLRDKGFIVTDLREVDYFPRMYYISWKDAVVEYEDISQLDENSEQYSLAQKLWIIAMKNQPKNC